jgi:thioredoxin 1
VAGAIYEVTDQNFQAEVLEADKPVLVDFWAPWCGPCRIVAPHLEELAGEREDLQIVKLNVDDNPQTAARYGVMSIPTLLLFKHGQVAHQIIGALPKSRLVQEIEPALAASPRRRGRRDGRRRARRTGAVLHRAPRCLIDYGGAARKPAYRRSTAISRRRPSISAAAA